MHSALLVVGLAVVVVVVVLVVVVIYIYQLIFDYLNETCAFNNFQTCNRLWQVTQHFSFML